MIYSVEFSLVFVLENKIDIEKRQLANYIVYCEDNYICVGYG